jgi:T-complex protein 1 subunit theta
MISGLLKEGTKNLSGLEQVIVRNIEAVKELSDITRTSLGPNGMNKLVITKLEKLIVTSDAATIISELEVVHPAARMAVMASEQQKNEMGDATNLVVVLVGELLAQAESLLRMGLHSSDVIRGYEKASELVKSILEENVVHRVDDITNIEQVESVMRAVIGSKQFGYVNSLSPIVSKACISVITRSGKFDVDNVRVCKVPGGGITDASFIRGVIIKGQPEGTLKNGKDLKVALYTGGIADAAKTDTDGKILIESPEDLENYSISEQVLLEERIKAIHDAGVGLVVAGGTIGEMAMHFFEKYGVIVIRTQSKFELRRISQATGARGLTQLVPPSPEQAGLLDKLTTTELGSKNLIIMEQVKEVCKVSTILVRAATENILDDIERGIESGVNLYKTLSKNHLSFVSGAGASEFELARRIKSYGETIPGQDQYAVKKFGEALEIVPVTLIENSGSNPNIVLSALAAEHEAGKLNTGISFTGEIIDTVSERIFDNLSIKSRAIELAVNATVTILRISQLIMAKTSTGPKLPGAGGSGTMGSYDSDPY